MIPILLALAKIKQWNSRQRDYRRERLAQGYCSACLREKAEQGYLTCDGCYAIGVT